ncbi:MAG: rhomboid family intramembrane serine protease [Nitrospinota bacterium]
MKLQIRYIALFLLLLWVLEAVNFLLGHSLIRYGILPRSPEGISGILFSPFIHAGFPHLVANTAPLAILGSFVLVGGKKKFFSLTLFIILLSGVGVWAFGREAYHVGASGLIFGYFGYLVSRGWYSGSFVSLVFSALTIFIYGGLIWGVLPASPFVSWEGHLSGFLAGAACAKFEEKK